MNVTRGSRTAVSSRLLAAAGALSAFVVLLWAAAARADERVYWANTAANSISYAAVDGAGGGNLNTTGAPISAPVGIVLDPVGGRIYWANSGGSTIGWAKLDGTGGGTLNTTGTTVNKPSALTVNPATRTLYWSNANALNDLSYARLDGSGGGDLAVPNSTTEGDDAGITFDPVSQRFYWADPQSGMHGNIGYETLGAGAAGAGSLNTGAVATLNYPFAIAYNNGDGFAYWTNDNGKIGQVRTDIAGLGSGNLNTTGATTTSIPGGVPLNLTGIAIDERHFRVYWGGSWNGGTNRISYARLDNSGGADVDTTGATVSQPGGVALLDVPSPGLAPTVTGTAGNRFDADLRPGQLAVGRHGGVLLALAELLRLRLGAERRRDQQPDQRDADARQGGALHLHDHRQQRGRQRVEHQQASTGDGVQHVGRRWLHRFRGRRWRRRLRRQRRFRPDEPAAARARPDPPDPPQLGQSRLPGAAERPTATAVRDHVHHYGQPRRDPRLLVRGAPNRPHRHAPLRDAIRSQPRRSRLHPGRRARHDHPQPHERRHGQADVPGALAPPDAHPRPLPVDDHRHRTVELPAHAADLVRGRRPARAGVGWPGRPANRPSLKFSDSQPDGSKMRASLGRTRIVGKHIAVGAALLWLCVMGAGALALAHSQSASRNALTGRLRERVADGAAFAALYVRDIQQREHVQAGEWLSGRTPDYNDLRVASTAVGAPAAVLLGGHGQVLQVSPAKPQLLGAVITGKYAHLRAAAGGHAAVSNVVPSAAGGLPVVGFAIPFATRYGRRVFSPAFAVSGTPLGRYMSHILTLPGRQVFLVDATGVLIASTGPRLAAESTLRSRDQPLALASTHPSGSYSSSLGTQVFATAAVAGTSWRVIGTDPAAELYASVDGSGSTLAWLALGGLTLAGLIIIVFGAWLSASREKLHTQARQLDRLARLDPLTGLSNRRDLNETLHAALAQAYADRVPLTVLMIDLDNFKQINDTLGHEAGDAALVSVAQTMRGVVRVGDTVGRWGGEEFLAILPHADGPAALLVAERLRAEIEQHPPLVDGARMTVTVGGAVWTSGTVADLIGRADAALYLGKRAGRNTVRLTDIDRPPLDSVPTQRPPEPVSV